MRSSLLPSSPSVVPSTDKNDNVADDKMLDFDAPEMAETSDDQLLIGAEPEAPKAEKEEVPLVLPAEVDSKPKSLADIEIDLDSIEPSNLPPRIVLEEPKGLKIVLNFAKDRPRPEVTVIVVSTTNEGPESISNFQFDVAVNKVRMFLESFRRWSENSGFFSHAKLAVWHRQALHCLA
jgi:Adaptin C-terminal domain